MTSRFSLPIRTTAGLVVVTSFITMAIAVGAVPPPQPFFEACHSGDVAVVADLLAQHKYLVHATSRNGDHCIHIAAMDGNIDLLKLLLEYDANPDVRSLPKNRMRFHPIGWATIYGRYEAIALLAKHGANLNADFALEKGKGEFTKMRALDAAEIMLEEIKDKKNGENSSYSLLGEMIEEIENEDEAIEMYEKTIDVLVELGGKRRPRTGRADEL